MLGQSRELREDAELLHVFLEGGPYALLFELRVKSASRFELVHVVERAGEVLFDVLKVRRLVPRLARRALAVGLMFASLWLLLGLASLVPFSQSRASSRRAPETSS